MLHWPIVRRGFWALNVNCLEDFFKWKLPSVWPKSDYGVDMILFNYNPFHSNTYTGNL